MGEEMKKVMVFGTFDVFHKGHENFFQQACNYGDQLIVVVARDKIVKKVKGKLPDNDEISRLGVIKSFAQADKVILGNRVDMYKRIAQIKPDIIALGYDQTAFTENLQKKLVELGLGTTKIIRLKPYKPEKYKTSILNCSKQ